MDMEKMHVKDLMVAVDKFPRISENDPFFAALTALEKAQEDFLAGKSQQRIVLVENDQGKVVGKLSPIDLFKGLETKYDQIDTEGILKKLGYSYIWKKMQSDYNLWKSPFKDLCGKAASIQIKTFLNPITPGQSVSVDDDLSKCFHLFVMNRHDSLFVFEGKTLVGLLRFSDMYTEISQTMKECSL